MRMGQISCMAWPLANQKACGAPTGDSRSIHDIVASCGHDLLEESSFDSCLMVPRHKSLMSFWSMQFQKTESGQRASPPVQQIFVLCKNFRTQEAIADNPLRIALLGCL